LLSRPELHRRQAKWQSVRGDNKTRMHEDAALREWLAWTRPILSCSQGRLAGVPDEFGTLSLLRECGRILQDEYRPAGGLDVFGARLEMPRQNVVFTDSVVRQKPVGSLGRSPALARERDSPSHSVPQLLKQNCEAATQPGVLEFAPLDFQIQP
jgi:hypothetical protein